MSAYLKSAFVIVLLNLIQNGVSGATKSVQMTQLERNTALDDNTCLDQDLVISTGVWSLSRCAFMCMESDACLTVFYNQMEGKCHGCAVHYSSNLPSSSVGFIHYQKQVKGCEDGWTEFKKSCYSISGQGTFNNGVMHCKANNAHPVFIETSEEKVFLETILATDASSVWYIGITDIDQYDVWRYFGTNEVAGYLNFADIPPDDDSSNSQQCVVILKFYGNQFPWTDHICADVFPTICEKDL